MGLGRYITSAVLALAVAGGARAAVGAGGARSGRQGV